MSEVGAVNQSSFNTPVQNLPERNTDAARDGRRVVSQYDQRDLAQNDTIDRGRVNAPQNNSSTDTVSAANGASDTNVSARLRADQNSEPQQVDRTVARERDSEASRETSLEDTASAFERQLQRSAIERSARESQSNVGSGAGQPAQVAAPEENVENAGNSESNRNQSAAAELNARSQPAETPSESTPAQSQTIGVEDSEEEIQRTEQNQQSGSVQSRFAEETAEDALGLNVQA